MGRSELIRPPRLRPGSTIGIAAVSGPVDPQRLDAGIRELESRGYRVIRASNLSLRRGFLAGSDIDRAAGYRDLLRDPSVDAIFFARGGYGASRVLSHLVPEENRGRPRAHLGGSDLTALFAWIGAHAGLVTFYGPMVAVSLLDAGSLDWEAVLSGATPSPHHAPDEDVLVPGRGVGPLVGGCLSLLASLAGTPEAVRGAGAVLFWEDVGEEASRLDRMLTQLERSGTFDGLQAMVIGSISPGARGGEESPGEIRAWLRDRFAGARFPVVCGLPAGHGPGGRTFPLGVRVTVDADRGAVLFDGPAVA